MLAIRIAKVHEQLFGRLFKLDNRARTKTVDPANGEFTFTEVRTQLKVNSPR